jgi:membrane-associated phospholipid phosphatase
MVHPPALAVRGYAFVDYITQGYLALVAILILFFHGHTVPAWPWLIGAHLVALGVIHWLLQRNARLAPARAITFLRHFYPVLLYAGFFAETGWLNQMFVRGYLDPVVIQWDQSLFGYQPSLLFMKRLPYLIVSEVLYAAYFSYYLMIGGVGLALYLRSQRQFFHYISVISLVFYICYLIYIFVPVIGPPIFFRTIFGYSLPSDLQVLVPPEGYPEGIKRGVFYQLMKWIYQVFEAPGAAIPSSHVAIALCTVYFSFRYLPGIRWAHLVMVLLLCVATIYCRYHYVSDVLAGVAIALLLIPIGNSLYLRFDVTTLCAGPHENLKSRPAESNSSRCSRGQNPI